MLFHFLRHVVLQTGALIVFSAPLLSGCVSHQAVDLTGTDCPCSGSWVCDTATDTCIRQGAVPGTGRDAGGSDTGRDTATDPGSGTDSGTDAPGGTDTPMDMGMDTPPATGSTVWIEAESGALTAPMAIIADSNASGGMSIGAPVESRSTTDPPADGLAVYTVNVEDGVYRIWGRVLGPVDSTDSFWVRVDAGPFARWNNLTFTELTWSTVHVSAADETQTEQTYELNGEHTITIAYREGGAQLDKLVVTNDMALTPTGMGE